MTDPRPASDHRAPWPPPGTAWPADAPPPSVPPDVDPAEIDREQAIIDSEIRALIGELYPLVGTGQPAPSWIVLRALLLIARLRTAAAGTNALIVGEIAKLGDCQVLASHNAGRIVERLDEVAEAVEDDAASGDWWKNGPDDAGDDN